MFDGFSSRRTIVWTTPQIYRAYISVPDGQKDVQLRSFHIQTKRARRIERSGRQMIPQQDSHQGFRYKVGGDLQVNAA